MRNNDSPSVNEETFKWTRINGFVVSFRKSLKRRSRSNSSMFSNKRKMQKIKTQDNVNDSLSSRKLYHRKTVPRGLKIQLKSNALKPSNCTNEEDIKKQASSSPKNIDIFVYESLEKIEMENSQVMNSPLLDNDAYSKLFSNLSKYQSKSAPDLSFEISNDQDTLKLPEETAYSRSGSVGEVQPLVIKDSRLNRIREEPPHLVWKASVDKITFVPERKESNAVWYSSNSDLVVDHPAYKGSSSKLAISSLITSVKRSINDLFALSTAEVETNDIITYLKNPQP